MQFPLTEPQAARLVDVLLAAQRLIAKAGCFTTTAATSATCGWGESEVGLTLEYLASNGYLENVPHPAGFAVWFPDRRIANIMPTED